MKRLLTTIGILVISSVLSVAQAEADQRAHGAEVRLQRSAELVAQARVCQLDWQGYLTAFLAKEKQLSNLSDSQLARFKQDFLQQESQITSSMSGVTCSPAMKSGVKQILQGEIARLK